MPYAFYLSRSEDKISSIPASLSRAAAARGLYAAYALTGNTLYLDAADEAYNFLISNYYVAEQHAFKTELNNDLATYTPLNFAVVAGGLREAALVGGFTEAATIYTRFFKKVANAMQLAEFDETGETGNDSDGDGIPYLPQQADQLAPVFAAEAQLDLQFTGIDDFGGVINETKVAIYPNPANESTTISIDIERTSLVTIEAIDFTGKKVQTILNRQSPEGQFKTSWNVNELPSGIYYVRIMVGGSSVVAKKVLVF